MSTPNDDRSARPGAERRSYVALVLAGWIALAAYVALTRLPYDDEWFSLGLAQQAWPEALRAMQADPHPPWVGLLDRLLWSMGAHRAVLHAPRLAATAAAVWLITRLPVQGTKRSVLAIAAFHPILLFYGGAMRWYPYLLLAHALRAWCIFGGEAGPRQRGVAFVVGAFVGSAATYLDVVFLVVDASWLLRRRARQGTGQRAWSVVAFALLSAVVLLVLSPLGVGHLPSWIAARAATPSGGSLGAWLLFGLVGEAHPPWPWILGGASVVFATACTVARGLVRPDSQPLLRWMLTHTMVWIASSVVGGASARASLMVWLVVSMGLLLHTQHSVRGGKSGWRFTLVAPLAYLVIGSVWVVARKGRVRADMAEIASAECAGLSAAGVSVVSPYVGIRAQLARFCNIEAHAEIPQGAPCKPVLFVRRNWGSGTVMPKQRAVSETLARQHKLTTSGPLVPTPHTELRRWATPRPSHVYTVQRWVCN